MQNQEFIHTPPPPHPRMIIFKTILNPSVSTYKSLCCCFSNFRKMQEFPHTMFFLVHSSNMPLKISWVSPRRISTGLSPDHRLPSMIADSEDGNFYFEIYCPKPSARDFVVMSSGMQTTMKLLLPIYQRSSAQEHGPPHTTRFRNVSNLIQTSFQKMS